ncbi:MAG: hypothetical protein P8163_08550 [Candidatus Thiodiazotropha sp.]
MVCNTGLTDYELGFTAWANGVGIGYAAAILRAVMALVMIVGGKYLFYSDLQNQMLADHQRIYHFSIKSGSKLQLKIV